VRVDKMQVAALEVVLAMIVRGEEVALPVHRMLRQPADVVKARAHRLATTLGGDLEGVAAHVRGAESVIGGGSVPGGTVSSWAVEMRCPDAAAFTGRLRAGSPSVFCRIEGDRVLFDLRTVRDEEIPDLVRAIRYALEGGDGPKDRAEDRAED